MNLMTINLFKNKEGDSIKTILKKHQNKYSPSKPISDKKFYAIVTNDENKEFAIDVNAKNRFEAEQYFEEYCFIHKLQIKHIELYANYR